MSTFGSSNMCVPVRREGGAEFDVATAALIIKCTNTPPFSANHFPANQALLSFNAVLSKPCKLQLCRKVRNLLRNSIRAELSARYRKADAERRFHPHC